VVQYKGTKKSLPEIARELNVDGLIEGLCRDRESFPHRPHSSLNYLPPADFARIATEMRA
jgi:hypothetical protein